jgi:integrase
MPRKKLTKPLYRLVPINATGKWAVSWTDAATGKTKRKTTGTDDHDAAALKMPAIIRELENPKNGAFTIGDLLDTYGETVKNKQSSVYALKPLREFFSNYEPDQLTDAAWQDYRDWRTAQMINNATPVKNKPVSDATAVRELRNMNAALNWGRRNGWSGIGDKQVWITDTPYNPRQDYLEREEILKLLKACTALHQRLYLRIALATAARMSAILELKWDKVIWPKKFEAIDYTEKPYDYDEETGASTGGPDFGLEMGTALRFDLGRGRSNKRRGPGLVDVGNMGLYDDLADAYAVRGECEFVIQWKGKQLSKMKLKEVYRRAELSGKVAKNHILKHTAITHLVRAGESYENISKLTGTSAKIIEETYGHHHPDLLARVGKTLSF